MPEPRDLLLRLAALLAIVAFMAVVDARGWRTFVRPGEDTPIFSGSDSFAHAHRVREFEASLPLLSLRDRHFSFPEGRILEWPAGFDYLIACALALPARLCGGFAGVGRALPLACACLGALTLLLFWAVSRGLLGAWPALLATALLACSGALYGVSAAGELDHHVVETIAVVLLLGLPLVLGPQGSRARAAALGAGLALAAWCSTLCAFLAALGLWGLLVSWPHEIARCDRRRLLALTVGLLAPLAAFCGIEAAARGAPFSLTTLSLAHLGLVAAPLGVMFARRAGRTRDALLVLLAAVVAYCVLDPEQLSWAWGFIGAANPFWSHMAEMQPIFLTRDGPTWSYVHFYFGAAYLLFPVAFLALRRGKAPWPWRAVEWLGLALFLLSFAQRRFAHLFSPILVLAALLSVQSLARSFRARLLAGALASLLLVEPFALLHDWFRNVPSTATVDAVAVSRVLNRLGGNPQDGVAAPPNLGNAIVWLTGHPVVASTFFYADQMRFDLRLREARTVAELLALLDRRGIRIVVVADDVRFRAMLYELLGDAREADRWRALGDVPCRPAFLRFAYDRLACGTQAHPRLEPVGRLTFSRDAAPLMRRAAIFRVR